MEKQERQDNYTHILKTTGLFGGVQVISILVSVVRTKLVALLLGTGGMGLMSLFNSTIKLVSDSTNCGISMSGVKDISEAFSSGDIQLLQNSVSVVRMWCIITAIFGMIVCALLSPLFNSWTFNWGNHTLHFLLLSPVIGMMAITGGELSILKGMRHLRHLAALSLYNVIITLVLSVPLFYFYRDAAIVPSLIIVAFSQMILTISYSYHISPLRLSWKKTTFLRGVRMIRLGIAFVLAGILGSGADFLIRSYLNNKADLDTVGIFNAGYMMIIVYGGMIFSAMETDFFPRLSAVKKAGQELNNTVNRQIEVTLLLIAPLLVAFITFLPIIVPLLYSKQFVPAIPMMQIAILALYMRAIKLPIAYIPLSRGDSKSYLLMEGLYDIIFVLMMILGYNCHGLRGLGWGILVTSIIDFIMLFTYMRWHYGYSLSSDVAKYAIMQIPLGILAFINTYMDNILFYWIIGIMLTIVSGMISLTILQSKTHLWRKLKEKIWRRM